MQGIAQRAVDRAKSTPLRAAAGSAVTLPVDKPRPDMSGSASACAPPQIEVLPLELPLIVLPAPKQESRERFRNWSRILGVVGTLAVHGLALNAVGGNLFSHRSRVHDAEGIGSVRVDVHAPPSEELILIDLDASETGQSDLARDIAALAPPAMKPEIDVVSPQPIEVADAPDAAGTANPTADAGDAATQALMAGRYRSQISARIERAWIRPRTPVNEVKSVSKRATTETPFVCQVQIRQDARGNVQEVLLLQCNGTEAWLHSLVVAINQSSPLPAPPIPSVFVAQLAMTFEALAYEPGAPADQYERQAPVEAIAWSSTPPFSTQAVDATSRRLSNSGFTR